MSTTFFLTVHCLVALLCELLDVMYRVVQKYKKNGTVCIFLYILLHNSMAILVHQHKPAWKSIGILS